MVAEVGRAEATAAAHAGGADPAATPLHALHPLVATALFAAVYLQRFGLHVGSACVGAGHVLVPAVALVLLARGRARLDLASLTLLAAFLAYAAAVAAVALAVHRPSAEVSPPSLLLLAALYAVLCVVPVPVEDLRRTLGAFNRHIFVLGLLGIAQFAAQFVAPLGSRLFSFEGLVPDALLIEAPYNTVIPLAYGSSWFKANGVFFLEPSLFSQFTAIALAAEATLFRRPHFVAVYGLAIVCSYSGSGLLTLAATLVVVSFVRPRHALGLAAFVAAAALALAAISQVAPGLYAYYLDRAGEFRNVDSSGYQRYLSPYALLAAVWHGATVPFGYGPGAAEKFRPGFDYTVNAAVKFLVDYGIVGATLFLAFLANAVSGRGPGLFLVVLCTSWYLLGGGYHLTSCVVHVIAAFLVWSAWPAPEVPA